MSRQTMLTITAVVVGCMFLSGLVTRIYERGRWQERVDDLSAQVEVTSEALKQYAVQRTRWEARTDSLETLSARLQADSARYAQRAVRDDEALAAAAARLAEIEPRIDTTSLPEGAQRLVGALRGMLTATERRLATCVAERDTARRRRGVCAEQLADRDAQVATLEGLRRDLLAQRDSALALLKPPPLLSLTLEGGIGGGCVMAVAGDQAGRVFCGPDIHVTLVTFRIPVLDGL